MKYRNASHVLPDELLMEIQKYTQGELIYIPKVEEKKRWGEGSGARRYYEERNAKIKTEYKKGKTVGELSEQYTLSENRILHLVGQKLKVSAIVLSAGLSRRMGAENKLHQFIDGQPLYTYLLNQILPISFFQRIVVTNYSEIQSYCKDKDFVVSNNEKSEQGISTSIVAGLLAAKEADGYMFFTCDQPFLSIETIEKLKQAFVDTNKIVVPLCQGETANPCIFPKRYKKELMDLTKDVGGKKVYQKHKEDICYVKIDKPLEFFDIDTKEQLMWAREQKER